MKITRFETFLANSGLRNYLFIRLTTDTGLTGIGEASLEWQEKTVETLCHEWLAERVIGQDPFDIEAVIGGLGPVEIQADTMSPRPFFWKASISPGSPCTDARSIEARRAPGPGG